MDDHLTCLVEGLPYATMADAVVSLRMLVTRPPLTVTEMALWLGNSIHVWNRFNGAFV
jgi:hypothetical protein